MLPCNTLPPNAQQTKIETYCENSSPQKRMSEFVLDCGNRLSVRNCRGSNSGFGHQMAVMTLPFLVLFNWTAMGIRGKVVWHWIISWKCPVNCLRHVNEYLVSINYCSKYFTYNRSFEPYDHPLRPRVMIPFHRKSDDEVHRCISI